ncbi:MAG: S8 family serine peptidase [Desulfosoma sp.]|uniref:S8 family serine peptidase n=1 Tax=Desulfosoma sp. TaxID=2603217 RepID=UPI00404B6B36
MLRRISKMRIPSRVLLGVLVLVFTLCGLGWVSPAFAQGGADSVPGEILVKFKEGSVGAVEARRTQAAMEERRVLQSLGVHVDRHWPDWGVHRARLEDPARLAEVLQNLRARDDVEFAEPNYLRHKLEIVPNDPYYAEQWALEKIGMPKAWSESTGSAGVLLGVVDSGIDLQHEDLAQKIWKNPGEVCGNRWDDDGDGFVDNCHGINVITGFGDPIDGDGHGTHIAGTAAAVGNNGRGMAGVDWRARILPMKFLGEGGGNVADFLEAVAFAKARGVRVINMSFGAYSYSEAEKQAIAGAPNILFVAAAGNERYDNDFHPLYPASYDLPNLISVASSNTSDMLSGFSNYGVQTVHVAAPGENILGTLPGNGYDNLTGTSMATALVSGLAALVFSKYPTATPAQVKARILRTVDLSDALQPILTKGRINAYRALSESISGPYVFRIIPQRERVGAQVILRGAGFGYVPGVVIFAGNVTGQVVSWTDEKIIVKVPEGAFSGEVFVQTATGTSNGVFFEVSVEFASGLQIVFPEVRAAPSHIPILVVSNFSKEPATAYVQIIEAPNRTRTTMIIQLEGLEKYIEDLSYFYNRRAEQSLTVRCQSSSPVSAAVVSLSPDLSKVVAMPPIIGKAADLGGVSPR